MSKIARFVGNVVAFASGATGTNRTVFGDSTIQSDVLAANLNADAIVGWEAGLDPVTGFPPQEFFNAVGFTATQLVAYLHQVGVAEYDSLQEYHLNSFCNYGGALYRSVINTNIGTTPGTDSTKWLALKSPGGVVQVVNIMDGEANSGSVVIPADDTIPQNTEGNEFMTLAITPTKATNKLKIEVVVNMSHDGAGAGVLVAALFQDSTADALAVAVAGKALAANARTCVSFTHYMTAGTTSATTFKVRGGGHDAGTVTFNGQLAGRLYGGVSASSMTITEIEV